MQRAFYLTLMLLFSFLLPIHATSLKEAQLQELSQTYSIPVQELQSAIKKAQVNPDILRAIASPFEQKPWFEYYPRFLAQKRVEAAVQFWRDNQALFTR